MTTTDDVPYMQRTRDYYRAQGYASDYQWAHHDSTPWHALTKPLNTARVTVISTAMPDTETGRSQRAIYKMPSTPTPTSMHTADLSWDKAATHTNDPGSFLPLDSLRQLAEASVIGALTPCFYSVPTEYSQRRTTEQDAPALLAHCTQAQTDIALLVPL